MKLHHLRETQNKTLLFFFISVIMSLIYNYCIAVAIEHPAFLKYKISPAINIAR